MLSNQLHRAPRLEGGRSRQQRIHRASQAVDVTATVDFPRIKGLFGREEFSGAHRESDLRDGRRDFVVPIPIPFAGVQARQTQIQQHRVAAVGDDHVARLDVTVNNAASGLQSSATIAPYNVSKFGVVALTETLRLELEAENATVSASVLCPGAINTRIVESKRNRAADSAKDHRASDAEKAFEKHAGRLLAQEGKDPSEVAEMVVNAILNDDFWILTHPEWKNVMKERVDALIKDNSLYRGFGG